MNSFPHLGSGSFPGISNVNVYGVPDFDYSKFANSQMRVKLTSVPWDLGEVHVGLKSVPMGNVVKFDNDQERDAWLDSRNGITFDTRFRSYHDEDTIKLPIPYEAVIPFNYVVIDYEEPPISYGSMRRVTRWLYFVRNVKSESMNSTICEIARDTWSMFVNSVEITGMMLERGHAPMFEAPTPSEFLESPIDNNSMLLAEDVNFGAPKITNNCSNVVMNDGEMLCCFATSAYPQGDWSGEETNSWHVPRFVSVTQDGNVSPYVFAIDPAKLSDFLHAVDEQAPQFPQTVKGVFFVPKKLVNLSTEFAFCGVTCHRLTTSKRSFDLSLPSVSDFGFSEDDAKLTKLYTYPYSVLELTDENGESSEIRIEDCSGRLTASTCLSLAFPWLNVTANVLGVGGKGSSAISFKNLNDRSMNVGGRWFDHVKTWDVPIMAIYQGNQRTNDFATYFDQKTQKDNAYRSAETAKDNAIRSASAAKSNAYASAATAKANADRSANAITSNAGTQTSANTLSTTRGNACASRDTYLGNELNKALQAWDSGLAWDCANADFDAKTQSASVAAAGAVVSGITSGAMSGGIPGAVAGAITGGIGGVCTALNTSVQINQESSKVSASVKTSGEELKATNNNNNDRVNNKNSSNTDITNYHNSAANAIAKKNSTTMKNSASATKTTTEGNANRTYAAAETNARNSESAAKDNVDEATANQKRQAGLAVPNEFGEFSNGEASTTRPMGLFLNVVRQADGEIRQAADAFRRYGYAYNGFWQPKDLNVGKRFTYWKASDLWMKANELPDAFADQIRNYLIQGVTVWKRPEFINDTKLTDNF